MAEGFTRSWQPMPDATDDIGGFGASEELFASAFPATASWLEQHGDAPSRQLFHEHRYAVDYNLNRIGQASWTFRKAIGRSWIQTSVDSRQIRIRFPWQEYLGAGDDIITGFVRVVDAGLLLTSRVLDLLPTLNVRWRSNNPKYDLHTALVRKVGSGSTLEGALDGILGPQKLDWWRDLRKYRDWVTHRGAPVWVAPDWDKPVKLRDPLWPGRHGPDAAAHDWSARVSMALGEALRDRVEIWCQPFASAAEATFGEPKPSPLFSPIRQERYGSEILVVYTYSAYDEALHWFKGEYRRITKDAWDQGLRDALQLQAEDLSR